MNFYGFYGLIVPLYLSRHAMLTAFVIPSVHCITDHQFKNYIKASLFVLLDFAPSFLSFPYLFLTKEEIH